MQVEKGEVIVILGPSGCGKSTLLRCINGLETIQGGEIRLAGEVISNRTKDMHLVRQKIGMVFQSYDLFPHLNVMKNLLLGPKHAHELNLDIEDVKADIQQRDTQDMNRAVAPLKQAEDAVFIDSSYMTIEEVVKEIMTLAEKVKQENA